MGPVAIAQLSGESAQLGWVALLSLMASISLNLGLLNLLPIPVLDGGHIFIMALEGVARRDFSVRVKEKMLLAGFVVLMMLMVTVIYNDLTRISWIERLMPWRVEGARLHEPRDDCPGGSCEDDEISGRLPLVLALVAGMPAAVGAQMSVTTATCSACRTTFPTRPGRWPRSALATPRCMSQLQAELDDARDEAIYLKVKLRKSEPIAQASTPTSEARSRHPVTRARRHHGPGRRRAARVGASTGPVGRAVASDSSSSSHIPAEPSSMSD